MATAMGLFDWLRPAASGEARDGAELAALAGRVEALEDRMRRHAAMCRYPQMKAAVEQLAAQQGEHLKTLKGILADRNAWAHPPTPVAHEGENDWARLSNDLTELATLVVDAQRAGIKLEGTDEATAQTLLAIAEQDSHYEAELRKIALKCDPQAID